MKKNLIILTFLASFVQANVVSDSVCTNVRLLLSNNEEYEKQVINWLQTIKDSLEVKNSLYDSISHFIEKKEGKVFIRSFMVKYDTILLNVNVCTSNIYLDNFNPTMTVFDRATKSIIMTSPPYVYNIIDREFIWDFLIKVLEKKFFYDKRKKMYIEI